MTQQVEPNIWVKKRRKPQHFLNSVLYCLFISTYKAHINVLLCMSII